MLFSGHPRSSRTNNQNHSDSIINPVEELQKIGHDEQNITQESLMWTLLPNVWMSVKNLEDHKLSIFSHHANVIDVLCFDIGNRTFET